MDTNTLTEISTSCTCNDNEDDFGYCDGWCWDDKVEMLEYDLSESSKWFVSGTYQIDGFPTWHGPVGGYFEAKTIVEFLAAITPNNTDWTLRYELPVAGQPFTGIVSHHDGSGRITVTPIPDSDE